MDVAVSIVGLAGMTGRARLAGRAREVEGSPADVTRWRLEEALRAGESRNQPLQLAQGSPGRKRGRAVRMKEVGFLW